MTFSKRRDDCRLGFFHFTCAAMVLSAAVGSSAAPPSKVALTGARIVPVVGADIAKGTLLIESGKITAIGKDVKIPYDAMEVDVSGKVLFPGMIDAHSAAGLDRPNENLPVTPFVNVYDALDPSRRYFEDALRDGVTSIHVVVGNNCVIGGVSRVVHPIGLTPDEMTQQADLALKISIAPKRGFDRMKQMATLRETFLELADYLEKLAEKKYEESLEKQDKKIDVGPAEARKRGRELITFEDYDDPHRNLMRLARGELTSFIYCGLATDVSPGIAFARDNGFFERATLVLGSECFKAMDVIKTAMRLGDAGRPVVLDPDLIYRKRDAITGELTERFVPKAYYDAGVPFALLPNARQSLAERYLNYQAARCTRNGVSRQASLEAITINPAKVLGLSDRVGSLEVGKVANVVVMSGDPLDFNTWVDLVYINGIQAYDRQTDPRLKQLFGDDPKEVEPGEESPDSEEKGADDSAEEQESESKPSPADKGDEGDNDEGDDDTDDGDKGAGDGG